MQSADATGFPSPHAAISTHANTMASLRSAVIVRALAAVGVRLGIGSRRVRLGADNQEVVVELHIDLGAVGLGHLDLVVALLVADFGAGDRTAPGEGQRGL